MDHQHSSVSNDEDGQDQVATITRAQALEAVRTLIAWAGDDAQRAGVVDTPSRVLKSYNDLFSGYASDGRKVIASFLEPAQADQGLVLLKGIPFVSHCEHHMLPIIGHVYIGYVPGKWQAGLSKFSRLVEVYARRLQIQEKLNSQIFQAIEDSLTPKGCAVIVQAVHHCMTTRGVHKHGVDMTTARYGGILQENADLRQEFISHCR